MPGYTVADYFGRNKGVSALAILGGNRIGMNEVFVRPDSINSMSDAYAAAFLMHELLHSLGLEDDDAKKALAGAGLLGRWNANPEGAPTVEITNAFARECFGVRR
jgi:hypothetical protein